jgi:hypothetical protein
MLTGGCACGAIRYETDGVPFDETVCHCSMCRRTTGAPCVAWFSVPRAQFRLTQGAPARFRSSARATRTFCANCGTALGFEYDARPDAIDVSTCSLDDPQQVPPKDHTYTSSRVGWLRLGDDLPAFARARNEA